MKGVRFYEDFEDARKRRSTGNCLAVFLDAYSHGVYEAYVAALAHPNSMPATDGVSVVQLRKRCKRVSESEARRIHPNLFLWLDDEPRRLREDIQRELRLGPPELRLIRGGRAS